MSTPKGLKVYVLHQNGMFVDVWSNLKQLCRDMNEKGKFASYSKLSKMSKKAGVLTFSKGEDSFQIFIRKVR